MNYHITIRINSFQEKGGTRDFLSRDGPGSLRIAGVDLRKSFHRKPRSELSAVFFLAVTASLREKMTK